MSFLRASATQRVKSAALLFAVVLMVARTGASGCSAESVEEEDDEPGATIDPLTAPAARGPITFGDACRAGTQITIAAVGDVLLHPPLQRQAYSAADGH